MSRIKMAYYKSKATGQVIKFEKSLGDTICKQPSAMLTHTSKGKARSFKNKEIKKHNNFIFLQKCINKGLRIIPRWNDNPNWVMIYPMMEKRNLFGIELQDNE